MPLSSWVCPRPTRLKLLLWPMPRTLLSWLVKHLRCLSATCMAASLKACPTSAPLPTLTANSLCRLLLDLSKITSLRSSSLTVARTPLPSKAFTRLYLSRLYLQVNRNTRPSRALPLFNRYIHQTGTASAAEATVRTRSLALLPLTVRLITTLCSTRNLLRIITAIARIRLAFLLLNLRVLVGGKDHLRMR